jgi:hypothetical protein
MLRLLFFSLFLGLVSLTSGCNKCESKLKSGICACDAVYEPVCGCDNVTYSSDCDAECSGVKEYEKGECGLK